MFGCSIGRLESDRLRCHPDSAVDSCVITLVKELFGALALSGYEKPPAVSLYGEAQSLWTRFTPSTKLVSSQVDNSQLDDHLEG